MVFNNSVMTLNIGGFQQYGKKRDRKLYDQSKKRKFVLSEIEDCGLQIIGPLIIINPCVIFINATSFTFWIFFTDDNDCLRDKVLTVLKVLKWEKLSQLFKSCFFSIEIMRTVIN